MIFNVKDNLIAFQKTGNTRPNATMCQYDFFLMIIKMIYHCHENDSLRFILQLLNQKWVIP